MSEFEPIQSELIQSQLQLSDRMKQYENQPLPSDGKIKNDEYFIIRLDGRSFSNFTSGFNKPFDKLFIQAMCYTTADLLEKFNCKTAYCHSDEITLIFSRQYPNDKGVYTTTHLFDGRIQKLLSLTAAYCSVRFNYYLNNLFDTDNLLLNYPTNEYSKSLIIRIMSCEQMFDARIIIFDDTNNHEIVNHQIWRSVYDCHRNAVQTYGHHFIGHKKILNKNTSEMIQMLELEHNIIWNDIPTYLKYGFYCKRELYYKEIDGKKIMRSKVAFKNFKINFSEQMLELLLAKYWSCADDSIKEFIGKDINLEII
jgi:tRNA(His) guanylyltransferase